MTDTPTEGSPLIPRSAFKPPRSPGIRPHHSFGVWQSVKVCPECLYVIGTIELSAERSSTRWEWTSDIPLHYCPGCGFRIFLYKEEEVRVWDLRTVSARFHSQFFWLFPWTWRLPEYWEIRQADLEGLMSGLADQVDCALSDDPSHDTPTPPESTKLRLVDPNEDADNAN